jgi:hypothetical protein
MLLRLAARVAILLRLAARAAMLLRLAARVPGSTLTGLVEVVELLGVLATMAFFVAFRVLISDFFWMVTGRSPCKDSGFVQDAFAHCKCAATAVYGAPETELYRIYGTYTACQRSRAIYRSE